MMLLITLLLSGLVTGLMYAYSCSVNIGLRSLPDAEYIKAMQAINIAIQNPAFFLSFMGLLLMFPVTAYQQFTQQGNFLYILIIALLIYFIGVFGVTAFGNVPLNNQLAKFQLLTSNRDEIAAMRKAFEKPWNHLHTIRTGAAIISFGLTILYVLKQKM